MKRIMFCGGGSAGHVIPNVALIEELKENFQTCYIGTDGIEKHICRANDIAFYECSAVKFVRGKFFCNLLIPFKLFKCIDEAGKILDKVKPDLLFCKGGYACVPAALAAKKRNIPVITHESDITAGLANKFIAKKCNKVLTSFSCTAKQFPNGIYTGTPMRQNLFGRNKSQARAKLKLDMRPTLLVLGGGNGSKILNDYIIKIAAMLCKNYNILHVCGKGNLTGCELYGYKQIEFADDMGEIYACADYALSRCGSNTANELIALKIPTLFVPLKNKRSRGDQIKNAEYFYNLGVCRVLDENDLSQQSLLNELNALFGDKKIITALETSTVRQGNQKILKEIISTLKS